MLSNHLGRSRGTRRVLSNHLGRSQGVCRVALIGIRQFLPVYSERYVYWLNKIDEAVKANAKTH